MQPCGAPSPPRQEYSAAEQQRDSTGYLQMLDRQPCDQVLRFHPQYSLRRRRHDEINRFIRQTMADGSFVRENQTEKPCYPPGGLIVEFFAIPEPVADRGRLGIETDIPGQRSVA